MSVRLYALVKQVLDNDVEKLVSGLSSGERCFVALSANRYDLLPSFYRDPIKAWHRLDKQQQVGVCVWRGWPRQYVESRADLT